ncbi:hypothetical protein SAMN05444159_2081 [Bradyrhizobium lablabi]|uniref:Uncharacterized protein n=1 Tax=Bradyrhizobium lablabi TaxID=722472 RepID=A0A1M6NQR9_9BRAD|nr:hypothetical protein SAMN05444159_2081 [Bradyrhizobium lablabi]
MRRSNPAFCVPAPQLDCFRLRSSSYGGQVAEPVIGRRFAPTRWLAMTMRERRPFPSPPGEGASSSWQTRSPILTIFWHCGARQFSSRTGPEAPSGNEPSMVLAEDRASKGSGNADSQPNVWSSGEIGRYRRCPRDSGCVPAHPASRRASASYLPLRAVWAICAWALRGCARSPEPFSAKTTAHQIQGISR